MYFNRSMNSNRTNSIFSLILVLLLISVIPVNSETYKIDPIEPDPAGKLIDIEPKRDSNKLDIGNKLNRNRNLNLNLTMNNTDIINGPKLEIKYDSVNRENVIIKPEVKKENNKAVYIDKEPEVISLRIIKNTSEKEKNSNIIVKFFKKIFGFF